MEANRRSARMRYDDAFAAVREIVDAHDAESLLKLGAPADEYEPEIAQLVSLVLRRDAPSETEVVDIWRRWFGDNHGLRGAVAADLTDELRRLHDRYADT